MSCTILIRFSLTPQTIQSNDALIKHHTIVHEYDTYSVDPMNGPAATNDPIGSSDPTASNDPTDSNELIDTHDLIGSTDSTA